MNQGPAARVEKLSIEGEGRMSRWACWGRKKDGYWTAKGRREWSRDLKDREEVPSAALLWLWLTGLQRVGKRAAKSATAAAAAWTGVAMDGEGEGLGKKKAGCPDLLRGCAGKRAAKLAMATVWTGVAMGDEGEGLEKMKAGCADFLLGCVGLLLGYQDDPMRGSVPSHGDASVSVHPDETENPINRSKVSRSIGNYIRAYFDGPYMVFKEVPQHTIDRWWCDFK
ncbi:hypothetical protein Droror1_Dr00020749 [Drosera rotundifolia]